MGHNLKETKIQTKLQSCTKPLNGRLEFFVPEGVSLFDAWSQCLVMRRLGTYRDLSASLMLGLETSPTMSGSKSFLFSFFNFL